MLGPGEVEQNARYLALVSNERTGRVVASNGMPRQRWCGACLEYLPAAAETGHIRLQGIVEATPYYNL